MRKIKFLLPILCLLILTLVLVFSGCSNKTYDIKKAEELNLGEAALQKLEYISTNYKDRQIGSDGSDAFIEYLKAELASYGYDVTEQVLTTSKAKTTKNIIAKGEQQEGRGKILLGASWDNLYKEYDTNPDGAYQTGASIAALLETAKYLKTKTLSYNLEIVFFAGAEDSFSGAQAYMDKLTASDKQNLKLYINYGYVVGGDNVYLYSRDKQVNYDSFIRQVISTNNITGIEKNPLFKNTIDAQIVANQMYQYSHIGMLSNNIIFMNEKIPSINFMSFNWSDYTYPIYTEKKGLENVSETSKDSYETLISRTSKETLVSQFNSVINTTIYSIDANQAGLMEVLNDADEVPEFLQANYTYYIFNIVIKILAVAIVLVLGAYSKSIISKNREKYAKLRQDANSINIDLSKLKNGEITEKDLEEIFKAEEAKLKGEAEPKEDDKKNNDDNISEDDVFQ
ncbi:MAG: M28 family peptidase [Clostridiales bacterium]|nr:M28 family peptidase [Clostridiales bacterium]